MSSKANGEEDDDCLFLEHVLDKLYDFGKWSEQASRLAYRPSETYYILLLLIISYLFYLSEMNKYIM